MNAPERTCLLIADISGYTSYLAGVELDHAQDILADLVGTVVSSLRPTFRLAKLEGDAAFMSAPTEKLDGSLALDLIERCYFAFRRRRRDVRQATSCECAACDRIPDLNLKFVAHEGPVARQRMLGLEELVGADVITVHRLLKNGVVAATGVAAYALCSQACIDALGLDADALQMRRHVEPYEGIGEVVTWVHDLERRWQEEDARKRVRVEPSAAVLETAYEAPGPPQVVWEFLTKPGRRLNWSVGITGLDEEARGNRRGVGTTNHCLHGPNAIVEEVLDWRPFDYFTIRTTMPTPGGRVRFLWTVDLQPSPEKTTVQLRFGPPKAASERAIMAQMLPMLEQSVVEGARTLQAQLEAELAAAERERGSEPAVPGPRDDGLFSEIAVRV